jgi:hypothetical protein
MRFGSPNQPPFRAGALVDSTGKVVETDLQIGAQRALPKN